jgi:predicted Ser/Thr protein kinase
VIGQVIDGRYKILKKLGEGGMGEVWLGENLNLGRKDALKILRAKLATDPQFVSRFRREARVANRLQHANIVRVYDFGKLDDGRFFLAMELADGKDLHTVLDEEKLLDVPRALRILGQLADALDHAHGRGVVHRDLKPENLVLVEHRGKQDVLKVLDFGIAKIVAPDANESRQLSMQGEVYGTANYISPEQVSGVGTDPRSDLYAIGCIAYELVTGTQPFSGNVMALMHAHVTQKPERPSARLPPDMLPLELDEVIMCLLEKDPAHRFQNGAALKRALEQVPGFEAPKMTGRWSWRGTQPMKAAEFDTIDTDAEWAGPDGRKKSDVRATRGAFADALRALADRLVESGKSDVDLVVGLAGLNQLDDELTQKDNELAAIDARAEELEESTHERESALGFQLGELYFERSQVAARGVAVTDIDRKIREFEERLACVAADLQKGLQELTERSVAIAAARARVEEKLDLECAAFEKLLTKIEATSRSR